MLNSRLFRLIHDKRLSVPVLRCFHHEFTQPEPKKTDNKSGEKQEAGATVNTTSDVAGTSQLTGALSQKYKIFKEEESPEILDIFEERERYQTQDDPEEEMDDMYAGLNLKRE